MLNIKPYHNISDNILQNKAACIIQNAYISYRKIRDLKLYIHNKSFETQNDMRQHYIKMVSRCMNDFVIRYYFPKLGVAFREPIGYSNNEDIINATPGNDKYLYKKDPDFVLLKYETKDQYLKEWSKENLEGLLTINSKLIKQHCLYFGYPISSQNDKNNHLVIAKNAGISLYDISVSNEYYKKHPKITINEFKPLIFDLVEAEKADLMLTDLHNKNITRKKMNDGSYRINVIDIDYITTNKNLRLAAPHTIYPFEIATRYRLPEYVQNNFEKSLLVIKNSYKFMMLINMAIALNDNEKQQHNWTLFCEKATACAQKTELSKKDYLQMLDNIIIPELKNFIKPEYLTEVIAFIQDPENKTISMPFNDIFIFNS